MELREIQTTDYQLAEQMLEIQRNAYAVEAELIGFDEIPARYETVEVTKLCIDPRYFRARLATTLLEHVLSLHEDKLVYVHTGKHNGPAKKLYTKLGFEPSAEFEPEPGVTLIRFTRT